MEIRFGLTLYGKTSIESVKLDYNDVENFYDCQLIFFNFRTDSVVVGVTQMDRLTQDNKKLHET